MANRVVFYVTAAVVACPLTTGIPIDKGLAAGACIEQPNRQASPGGRWYYRTDRGTGLKCWFLKEPDAMTPQVDVPKREPSTQAVFEQDTTRPPTEREFSPAPSLNQTQPDNFEE
jgi:hypothetical protein